MRVKYIGESDPCCLINGKTYECLGEEQGFFRIVDEEGVDDDDDEQERGYLYEKELFITEE